MTVFFSPERSSEIGDREKIEKLYRKRKARHADTLGQIAAIRKLLEEFKKSNRTRLEKYIGFRDRITERTREVFRCALESCEFTGQLNIVHGPDVGQRHRESIDPKEKIKYLEIKINPKKSQNCEAYSDTRSLSGGERSYGTVAFLVALWEACSTPFKILDEVDVFMVSIDF